MKAAILNKNDLNIDIKEQVSELFRQLSPNKTQLDGNITLQGNFDPSRLLSPIPTIKKMVHEMIDEFGKDNYIVNLGHGILPNIPVDHAKAFVEAVKEYNK